MYLWDNSLLMLPSLILFLKLAMQMCNHVLYRIDAMDFAFCITAAAFLVRCSSVAAAGDPSRPPYIYVYTPVFFISVCFVFTASIKLYSSHNQGKLYKVY